MADLPSALPPPRGYSRVTCMQLLLIEDDLQAAEYLVKGLRESGYSVEHSPGRPRRPGEGDRSVTTT